jgi:hypothetical protein
MAGRYEAVKPPRFEIEQGLGGERIRIRARRSIFALLFIPFWLVMWTIGGVTAATQLLRGFDPFVAFWLVAWGAGELAVTFAWFWMLWGAELVGVTGGDLELGQRLCGLTRSRLYRGRDIRNLSAAEAPPFYAQAQLNIPFLMRGRYGAVKFGYGGRTIRFAQGLDEAEGRLIVERLLRHLPAEAGR